MLLSGWAVALLLLLVLLTLPSAAYLPPPPPPTAAMQQCDDSADVLGAGARPAAEGPAGIRLDGAACDALGQPALCRLTEMELELEHLAARLRDVTAAQERLRSSVGGDGQRKETDTPIDVNNLERAR